ncbi:MAG: hypothetical protein PHT07_02660 [Paludibacter sp.]|nr:hypothetical protein [Paludibacter sp.]
MKQLFISLIVSLLFITGIAAQSIANYGFSTSTAAVLENMSTGTTSLIGPSTPDVASALTTIGFSFEFTGNTFTEFSVNSNGQMRLGATVISGSGITNAAPNTPLLVPISGGNAILSTGKVHYKVKGTAPNRILIVEWKDLNVPDPILDNNPPIAEYNPTQVQVYLHETTGTIEFRYGMVSNNSVPSVTRATFISSSNTANTVKYIAPDLISAVNGSSAGTYPLTLSNTDLLTSRQYVFIPSIPDAPTVDVVNNCDGTSTLTASNYTGTLLWSTMETTPTITVTVAGVYTVTQTVGGFTSEPGSGTAAPKTTPPAPTVTVINNCDGTSTLTASGFTGSLMWSTQQTSASIVVTTSGTYTVTQTVNGCTSQPGSGIADPKTPIQASVTIAVDNNPVCSGTSVTFTATPVNGGASPAYQWYKGSTPVGTNSATYSYTPANGDMIKVVMTSNAGSCVTDSPATSNIVTMVVNQTLTASVTIAVDNNTVCSGTSVTFTATPVNGGAAPTYQWYKGSTPVGTNSATYSYTPANGDMIKVVMTSNAGSCVTGSLATSNTVTMVVNPIIVASVTLDVNYNPVTLGRTVTFEATPHGGGTSPVFRWFRNNLLIPNTGLEYTYTPLDKDEVYVEMTSNASPCLTGSPVKSNTIKMSVSFGTSLDQNSTDKINIYSFNKTIFVSCQEEARQIFLYNSLGTLIASDQHVNGPKKFDMSNGACQYYFVKIITQSTVYTQRVLLK